jgi:murein L,D-transpeptidase YafK
MSLLRVFSIALLATAATEPDLKTVDDRVAEFGETVRQRLAPQFTAAGVAYPPARVALLGFKQERSLEVYAANAGDDFRFVCAYPVLAASGVLGPKLRQGDRQVPEGVYRVEALNPNSLFHLSLRLDYPNTFDREHGASDGREDLGGDIMIHGDTVSKGCLAMGDAAAEDLFVLAALTGIENVCVVLAPVDFRRTTPPVLPATAPAWSSELYEILKRELARYPRNFES